MQRIWDQLPCCRGLGQAGQPVLKNTRSRSLGKGRGCAVYQSPRSKWQDAIDELAKMQASTVHRLDLLQPLRQLLQALRNSAMVYKPLNFWQALCYPLFSPRHSKREWLPSAFLCGVGTSYLVHFSCI